ncbi:MAG: CDP-diacylglycerol--glycerol-3-phosphate 3-phosphatidyltransferase [Deltaproteobacteria bacterium]|nr:CDP-diacylglycerol--glycerol-3-phosphate 3-phosphatidyltransferase [Deltaproteobacteria bacterium]MDZ4225153.1 CDP-diacylglycerol--glycerol-3-phosphate 3-phosphatidyltransferase [bacterium]
MPLTLRQRFLNVPNYITMGRVMAVPVLMAVMMFMRGPAMSYTAAAIFILAMVSDMIDGYYARKFNIISTFGQFFDPLADKLLFLVAMIFMVQLGRMPAWIVCIFLGREVIVTTLRSVAIDEGVVIAASTWGKYKSALVSTTTVGLLIHYPLFGINWRMMAWVFIWPALFFSIMSGVHYTVGFIQELKKK